MASKEYLYRVKNRTPGAPDRYVKARLPSQALAFVAADVLSAELCDGIAGAEAVLAGFKIESALTPASSPEPEPDSGPGLEPGGLIRLETRALPQVTFVPGDTTVPSVPGEADPHPTPGDPS